MFKKVKMHIDNIDLVDIFWDCHMNTHKHIKLPYAESDHLSIKTSISYSDWQWHSRF